MGIKKNSTYTQHDTDGNICIEYFICALDERRCLQSLRNGSSEAEQMTQSSLI